MSPIAAYAYDDLGRRTSVTRGNGVSTAYGYDPASRLTSLAHDLAGAANDNVYGYGHNPSGQIVAESRSNSAYAYSGLTGGTTQYGIDGLNRSKKQWAGPPHCRMGRNGGSRSSRLAPS